MPSAVTASAGPAPVAPTFSTRLSARGAFLVNAAFVVGLLVLSQLPLLDARPVVRASIVGAALVLLAWSALLFGVLRRGQTVTFEVALRPQHYLQACLQGSLILYWGFYWREVYHAAPLIVAQLLFAYGFDSLLSWTHRRKFALGFGPFPIIFSLTLFFWFKDPWFYWQFVMVAIGFAREGVPALEARRREHAHLQPFVVPAGGGVGIPAALRCDRHDVGLPGGGNRVLSAAHVSRDLPHRACRGSICSASRR